MNSLKRRLSPEQNRFLAIILAFVWILDVACADGGGNTDDGESVYIPPPRSSVQDSDFFSVGTWETPCAMDQAIDGMTSSTVTHSIKNLEFLDNDTFIQTVNGFDTDNCQGDSKLNIVIRGLFTRLTKPDVDIQAGDLDYVLDEYVRVTALSEEVATALNANQICDQIYYVDSATSLAHETCEGEYPYGLGAYLFDIYAAPSESEFVTGDMIGISPETRPTEYSEAVYTLQSESAETDSDTAP